MNYQQIRQQASGLPTMPNLGTPVGKGPISQTRTLTLEQAMRETAFPRPVFNPSAYALPKIEQSSKPHMSEFGSGEASNVLVAEAGAVKQTPSKPDATTCQAIFGKDQKDDIKDSDSENEEGAVKPEKEKEKKRLTEEEAEDHIITALTKASSAIRTFLEESVRNREVEGCPYTPEIRKSLLTLSKMYFTLKTPKYPYSSVVKYKVTAAIDLVETGGLSKMCDILLEALRKRDFLNMEDGSSIKDFWIPIKNCLQGLMNFSDTSEPVRNGIGHHPEMIKEMASFLQDMQSYHLERKLSVNINEHIKTIIHIIHNLAVEPDLVILLRENDTNNILLPYLDSSFEMIRLTTLCTLADMVNEEEAEVLQANPSIFSLIIRKIYKALKKSDHKDVGWSVEELVRALKGLSRNDSNKKVLVSAGCLPLLVQVMIKGRPPEVSEAVDCLWALSFDKDNKCMMVMEPNLVDMIHSMYENDDSSHAGHSCEGILWSLKEEMAKREEHKQKAQDITKQRRSVKKKENVEDEAVSGSGSKIKGHVMISYQWGNQEEIKNIAHILRTHGFPVWLDIDYMGGSTLQAMANAVENSFAVIMAMSQKYKDSPNTRAEAEYAFQQRKTIIPLVMQKGYRADGWLGFILGSKLFYDFSGKYSFESRMDGLLKAVEEAAHGGSQVGEPLNADVVPSVAHTSLTKRTSSDLARPLMVPQSSAPDVSAAVLKWGDKEKKAWLTKHKLEKSSMSQMTLEEIVFLFKLQYTAPEFFYRCLEQKLNITGLTDLAHAQQAFEKLGS